MDIVTIIRYSLSKFFEKDSILLFFNSSERSIVHRFAKCLEKEIFKEIKNKNLTDYKEYKIDCEYNRHGMLEKTLELPLKREIRQYIKNCEDYKNVEKRNVFPDIIFHERGKDNNLFIIEVKKDNEPEIGILFDKLKIIKYKEELKYEYGFLLTFKTNTNEHEIKKKFYTKINKKKFYELEKF